MTRSGYNDSCDGWDLIRWRGAVASAIKGKRGQAFLREMRDTLDAMPEKVLIAESLVEEDGAVCAMGAVGQKRGMDLSKVDPEDRHSVAEAFGISPALAAEIAYENDEGTWKWRGESPAERWERMRDWIVRHLAAETAAT